MAAENGPLEIVRDRPLPAPAQSTEPPNSIGFRARFVNSEESHSIGVLGADTDALRRNDHNRLLRRVRQRIDFVAAIHGRRSPAEEEKRNVRAEPCGDFHQARQRNVYISVKRIMPMSAAAASLDPPPKPRATGIFFSRCTQTSPLKPISGLMAWIARHTRLSGPAERDRIARQQTLFHRAIEPGVIESVSVSCREMVWNMVRSSW